MLRVACFCVGAIVMALTGAASASAQEPEASPETAEISSPDDARAQAVEVLPPVIAPAPSAGDFLVYGGVDGWRFGASAYAGSDFSFRIGGSIMPMVRLFAANGIDDFNTRFASFRTDTARVSILPGIQWREGSLDIKLFAGGDFERRMPLRPSLDDAEQFFGGRVAADVWWEPAPDWMLSGSASATSIEDGRSARVAAGWKFSFAWVGPEIQAVHDVFNTQYRAGAHLSGIKIGETQWSIAGGYTRDSFGRSGPYARIGVSFRP